MNFPYAILSAYIITVVSEIGAILLIQRPKKFLYWILVIFLVNSFTHPIAIYCLDIINLPYIFVELSVFIVEAVLYMYIFDLGVKRAILISFTANLSSISAGLIIRSIF